MSDDNQSDSEEFEDLVRLKKKFKTDKPIKQLSLFDAVAKNDVQQLNYLLDLRQNHGVDIDLNEKDTLGRTPLHKAAISNKGQSHFELIQVLLNNGADINARNYCSRTPLWYLVQNGNLNILKLFLRFKADLTNAGGYESSILESTVQSGDNLDVIKFLVEDIGLDVNHRNKSGATPLHWAARYNLADSHYDILVYLLNKGADVNARASDGWTPISKLVSDGNLKVVDLFLKHNADVHAVSDDGKNILFSFSDKSSNIQVLEKMIWDFNLDVNHTDNDKRTPLHHIISYNNGIDQIINIKVIKCLLKNGADFNTYDEFGYTPSINAVIRISQKFDEEWFLENMEFFQFLVEQTDFSVVHEDVHIFEYNDIDYGNYDRPHSKYLWKWILEHLAKLKFLSIPIHPKIQEFIENHTEYKDYSEKCTKELVFMSNSKLQNSWITFFNFLVDDRRKLKNYAGNTDLMQDFRNNDWVKIFPIYGVLLKKKMEKGIKRRKLFDKSSILLSDCLPIFNPNHLIVKDIFECILSKKDLTKFCGN